MDEQKKYWIDLFISKCTSLHDIKTQIDHYIDWCNASYSVSDDYLKYLKKKYTTDDYIKRFIPVIDKYFTIDDLKVIIKFYSTEAGKKLLDHKFIKDIGKIGSEINIDIEYDFAIRHNK